MKVGLIDVDGKITNLAIQKLSAYHKAQGHEVVLNPIGPSGLDRTYVSMIFTKSREKALSTYGHYPEVDFGGTGYSLTKRLPPEVEAMNPDYDLYTVQDIYQAIRRRPGTKEAIWAKATEIWNSGIGFTTRGCIRKCSWCAVPRKEGNLHQVGTIKDLINQRGRLITLLDNSFTADPLCLDKLREIRDRKLVVNISQGIDVRLVTEEISLALSQVRHWGSLHYAWDQAETELSVFEGIKILTENISKSAQMCYCLCGYSDFDEDMYRVMRLAGQGIRPYVMVHQNLDQGAPPRSIYEQTRLNHFKRWINSTKAIFKKVPFAEYTNWARAQEKMSGILGATQMELAW